MTKPISVCLLTLSALFAAGCEKAPEKTAAATPDVIPSVATVRVARADLSGSITLTGEFVPYQEVDVMAKVSGYVKSINVDIGDRVREGQVLATLEVPEMQDDLTRAEAAIDQATAEAARAEDDLRRAESAHDLAHLSLTRIAAVAGKEPGLVPQQEVDEVRSRDLVAEAQVAAAKSNLGAARELTRGRRSDEARLKTMRNYQTITAPFDGVVTKRYANSGALIQAGTASQTQAMPVVRVAQNMRLRLILPVPESAVSRVVIGHTVNVRVASLNRTFAGRVARFTDNLQLSTRTMDTEVDVPNPSLTLIPGMYAEVDLNLQEHKNTLSVPPDAIDGSGANARAFVVTSANTIQIVPIQTGLVTEHLVEVLGGIKEGDLLVAGRREGLKDGDRVKPINAGFVGSR